MKAIAMLAVLIALPLLAQSYGSLEKAEKITAEEKAEIAFNQSLVDNAIKMLEATKAKVFAAHGCSAQSYMEWTLTCSLDGDFVLRRRYDWMINQSVFVGTTAGAAINIQSPQPQ